MKIGIIGAGAVGAACAMATVMRGCASELILVNRSRDRAKGMATDMGYGAALSSTTRVTDGDYSDLAGAALVMITAGVNEKSGGATDRSDPLGRLRLLDKNAEVYRQVIPQISFVSKLGRTCWFGVLINREMFVGFGRCFVNRGRVMRRIVEAKKAAVQLKKHVILVGLRVVMEASRRVR